MSQMGIKNSARAVLFLAAAFLSVGWGNSWEELKSAAGTVQSISAEFVQEKHMKILARPLISSGVFYFQAPGSLRWEYRTPLRNILLMTDAGTERYVWTDAGFAKDANANLQAMQVVLEHIAQWLEGQFENHPMFAAKLEPGPRIILTPKEQAFTKMIQRIELVFSQRPGIIESVTIHESDDSFTRLVFKNVAFNPPIDRSVFRKAS